MNDLKIKLETLKLEAKNNKITDRLIYKNKESLILKKKKIIKSINYVISWLQKNDDKEDVLNMLYYIIYIHKYILHIMEQNDLMLNENITIRLKNFEKIVHSFLYSNNFLFNEFKDIKPFIKHDTSKYNKNIDYKFKIKELLNRYINTIDLEINFLPDFIDYNNFIQIIVWITFCKVLNKKPKNPKPNFFLYDIYLFQNENNNSVKITLLIQILQNMKNYIQFFDYEK